MKGAIAVGAGCLFATLVLGEGEPDPCRRVTAQCLAHLSMAPAGPEMQIADPRYLDIVARALEVVPELAALVEDGTPTSQRVPLFGGVYAIGDIAHAILSDIIRAIPWLEFVPGNTDEKFRTCGYCVYWDYARGSAENRRNLKRSFEFWYSQHASELVWKPHPELLTKGYYAIRTSNSERK